MIDKEKVIEDLNIARYILASSQMLNREMQIKIGQAISAAIDVLEEQEPVEPGSFMDGHVQRFACKKCGKHLLYTEWGRDNYCPKCGQAVKWNE